MLRMSTRGKPRRIFTREFKIEAVKLFSEQGSSFAEAAANLGITESQLRKWKQNRDGQGGQAFPGRLWFLPQRFAKSKE